MSDRVFAREAQIIGGGARDMSDFNLSSYLIDEDSQIVVFDNLYALLMRRDTPLDCKAAVQRIKENTGEGQIVQQRQNQTETTQKEGQTQPV